MNKSKSNQQIPRQSSAAFGDVFGKDRFEEEKDEAGPKDIIHLEDTDVFDLPKPIYKNVIAIGALNRLTRLDQILLQIDIPLGDYVYWSSDVKLRIEISPNHYV